MPSFARVRLAGMLCALALAGCGDQDEEATTAPATTSTAPSIATPETPSPAGEPDGPGPGAEKPRPGEERPLSERDVIAAVLTSEGDPQAACGELVSEEFLRAAYGDRSGCLAARKPAALADSIEVKRIVEIEAGGTATVIPTGGPYDGIDVRVEFESADGFGAPWRITALEADVPAGP